MKSPQIKTTVKKLSKIQKKRTKTKTWGLDLRFEVISTLVKIVIILPIESLSP